MDTDRQDNGFPEVERLLVALARAWHWTGLYRSGHPVLAERVAAVHAALKDQVAREPSGRLVLGIARDRVLYRDAFLGRGHPLVGTLAENLYVRRVATVIFGPEIAPEGMIAFFRTLHEAQTDVPGGDRGEVLPVREPAPGIGLYPYNYKEVLGRRIVDPAAEEDGGSDGREEALWRMLLTANVADGERERKVVEELAAFPDLIPAVLRRAKASERVESRASDGSPKVSEDAVTPEVLRRMFHRLGDMLGRLPENRKAEILVHLNASLEELAGDPGRESAFLALAEAMADGCPDEAFVDLLAALLTAEEKGGDRLRRIFRTIALERDGDGSLTPRVRERARESLRARTRHSLKTWETVERLFLARSEGAYVGEDHARLLDHFSAEEGAPATGIGRDADPEMLAAFEEEGMRRTSAILLLELLAKAAHDEAFRELLEEIRKIIPNLISRREIALLEVVLPALLTLADREPSERRDAVREVIRDVDFGYIVDLSLSRDIPGGKAERVPFLLARFPEASARPILDRLLVEQKAPRRRALLAFLIRLGPAVVPEVMERLADPRWYFVRNMCLVLGEAGDGRAVPGLLRALEHEDHRVKREAIQALGKLKAAEAVPALGRILLAETLFSSSKDDPVRMDAANVLFRIGGAEAASLLHRGKGSRRAAVRDHCITLLRTLTDR